MSDEGTERIRFGDFPDWYRPLFDVTDPDVAFDLARTHLRRKQLRGNPRRVHLALARAWFEIAAAAAGSAQMHWRISSEHAEHGFAADARSWMHRAIRAEYPHDAGGIQIDPSTFVIQLDEDGFLTGQDFSAQVVCADPDRANVALAAAGKRFMLVTADGRQVAELDELWGQDDADRAWRRYTPNYVSDPQDHPTGPWIYSDCKDGVMPLMARTMILILVQELHAAGVEQAQIRPTAI